MNHEMEQVERVAMRLKEALGSAPRTAVVFGSGLGVVADRIQVIKSISTEGLGLPKSTVPGHAGRLIVGTLGGASVVALSGRVHLYEGYSAHEIVRYVRAFHRWGVKHILLTCSAGGIATECGAGELMLISDHINFQKDNPLIGPPYGSTRFPDLGTAYSPRMRAILREAAESQSVTLHEGVYAAMNGPAYETPAEIRMLRTVGASAVGMSTVPEIIASAQIGLEACALAVISNRAAGLADEVLTHEDVTRVAKQVGETVAKLLEVAIARF